MTETAVQTATYGTFYCDVSLVSQDQANWRSLVGVTLSMYNGGTILSKNLNHVTDFGIEGDGSWFITDGDFSVPAKAKVAVYYVEFWVTHNSDGTRIASFYGTLGVTNTSTFGNGGTTPWASLDLPSLATVPAAPSAVAISSVTGVSVHAAFTDGANGGLLITSRRIGYGANPAGPSNWIVGNPVDITGLAPDTMYYFWAQTYNSVGWGALGPQSSQKTDAIPSNPGTPVVTAITKNTATVIFADDPNNGGEIVDSRRLYYSLTNNSATAGFADYTGPTSLIGLIPKTKYYLWAKTHNSVGWSGFSIVGYFTTLAVPEPPGAVSASNIWQTTLDYAFTDGVNNGVGIDSREIAYSVTDGGAKTTFASGLTGSLATIPPGSPLYLYARTHNSQGWGDYSIPTLIRTVAGAYVRDEMGIAHEAVPYQNVSGVWKLLEPYVRSSGIWRRTGR